MHKSDPEADQLMLKILAAETRHPKKQELPSHSFPRWQQPTVMVGKMRGTAIAWTANFGLIQFVDVTGAQRLEWFEALLIKRVDK